VGKKWEHAKNKKGEKELVTKCHTGTSTNIVKNKDEQRDVSERRRLKQILARPILD